MQSRRFGMILAALAVVALGAGRAAAAPDGGEDDLAEGDWHGGKKWHHLEGGGGLDDPLAPLTAPAASTGGTATPASSGSNPSGPFLEPFEPHEPGDLGEPTDPGEPVPPPPPPPEPSSPPSYPPMAPAVATCTARWVCEVVEAVPTLYESETMLTITIFRTDAFAFVSNAFCRSESTWFVDAWATTQAGHDGLSQYRVDVRLEQPCPYCQPKIDLKGISQLLARVQTKTPWGGLDASTTASSAVSTQWAGDIDCGDRCSVSIADGQGTGEVSLGMDPLKVTKTTTKGYVLVSAEGGKGAGNRISEERTSLLIMNRAGISTFASGTDDNSQAKALAGYSLVIHGESACGPWGEFEIDLEQ